MRATQRRTAVSENLIAGVKRTRLGNGLTVLMKELHDKPIVACMIWYKVGSRNEELGQTGKSHFLEHMLFKGTSTIAKGEIDRITLKNGGSNNAFTSNDYTAYYFTFASDRWEAALEIEASRMRNTTFARKEFELEKRVVIEELQIGLDSPWGALTQEVDAAAFRQHPYRNPVVGWIADLKAASAEEMKAYYDRWYHPKNATIVLAGDFHSGEVLARIEKLFGRIPAGPAARPMAIREEPQRAEKRVVLRKPTELERLMIAFHAPEVGHADSFALKVLATLLSAGKTSRLYQRLQERDQSVTSASASYDEAIDSTLFLVRAQVKPGHSTEEVEAAIGEEISRFQHDAVSANELRKVRQLIEARLVLSNEEYLNQALLLGLFETIASCEYLGTLIERLQGVTGKDIRRVANEYLRPENSIVGYLKQPAASSSAGGVVAGGAASAAFTTRLSRSLSVSGQVKNAWFRMTPAATGARTRGKRSANSAASKPPRHLKKRSLPLGPRVRLYAERAVLSNGVVVIVSENRCHPGVAINAVVRVGSRYERDDQAGLASVTGQMLSEGTSQRTAQEIALAIESVGGTMVTFGGYSRSGFASRVLARDLELALDLGSDAMRNPSFPEERVAIEVSRRVAELKSRMDRPSIVASDHFNEIVFRGSPAHRPSAGYSETVQRLTREDLASFYKRFYSPDRTIISVAGDVDATKAIRLAGKYFSDWRNPSSAPPPAFSHACRNGSAETKYVPLPKAQVHIYVGHLGITRKNPDYYALQVFDTIFGSSPGFTSRIPRILRDRLGLAYSTFSNIADSAGEDPGRFYAYIGTSPENMTKAISAIRREIERITTQRVSSQELADAKAYLTGSFVFDFEKNSQVASFLIEEEIFQLGFDYLQRYPELINGVSAKDVLSAAATHIDPSSLITVVAGPVDEKGRVARP